MQRLMSWASFKKSQIQTGGRVRVHDLLISTGFSCYYDSMDSECYIYPGETRVSVAKKLYETLLRDKPIDPVDGRVVWTVRENYNGDSIALYYKFKPRDH